jgi:hypothetical protein
MKFAKRLAAILIILMALAPSVAQAAITDNLVAYYKFDESSGNASDSVGTRTLTNTGTATFVSGLINNAMSQGTSNSSKYFKNTTDDYGIQAGAQSISLWVKLNTELTVSGNYYLFADLGSATSHTRMIMQYTLSGAQYQLSLFRIKNGVTAPEAVNNISAFGTSAWHHIVISYDGSVATMYLDGSALPTTLSISGSGSTGVTSGLWIGVSQDLSRYSSAQIDEVAVFARAVSAADVLTLNNGGAGCAYAFSTCGTTLSSVISNFFTFGDW